MGSDKKSDVEKAAHLVLELATVYINLSNSGANSTVIANADNTLRLAQEQLQKQVEALDG